MKRSQSRHHTEEELLLHFLQEETPVVGRMISDHLEVCDECAAIYREYGDLVTRIQAWAVPEVAEDVWQNKKQILLAQYREDLAVGRRKGLWSAFQKNFQSAWNYALENPLPTLAYIAVALAFALERTITTLSLDQILPGANQVFEILRQVF
jgi:hypothetical protein